MTYKSILLHVDETERCAVRMDIALKLAETFGAHVTALALTPSVPIPPPVELDEPEAQFPPTVLLVSATALPETYSPPPLQLEDPEAEFPLTVELARITVLE